MWEEFRVSIAKQTLSRELRALEYRKLSARPQHHACTGSDHGDLVCFVLFSEAARRITVRWPLGLPACAHLGEGSEHPERHADQANIQAD